MFLNHSVSRGLCVCMCVCACAHVHARMCMRACMHACMRACVCAYVCLCVCLCKPVPVPQSLIWLTHLQWLEIYMCVHSAQKQWHITCHHSSQSLHRFHQELFKESDTLKRPELSKIATWTNKSEMDHHLLWVHACVMWSMATFCAVFTVLCSLTHNPRGVSPSMLPNNAEGWPHLQLQNSVSFLMMSGCRRSVMQQQTCITITRGFHSGKEGGKGWGGTGGGWRHGGWPLYQRLIFFCSLQYKA